MNYLLPNLFKRVCGLPVSRCVDGRPIPKSMRRSKPIAVLHDHRLSAGVFEQKSRMRGSKPKYRLVVWKTFKLRDGTEIATTSLYRDEIETAVTLLNKCNERMSLR